LPITPPIRLRKFPEAFAIEDGAARIIAYVYFDDDASRRDLTKRLTKADAEEAAKIMAAALRERLGRPVGKS